MKQRTRTAAAATLALLVPLLTARCGTQTPAASGPVMAVSIYPVADIARSIAGDRVTVVSAIPAGANPHTYEPRPSQVAELQQARMFTGISRPFDGWMEKFLPRGASIRYLLDDADKSPGHHPGHESAADDGHHGKNPHLWLSVKGARGIAAALRTHLASADPAGEAIYRRNEERYLKQLEALDAEIRAILAPCKRRAFLQWHPSWDYFAAEYGLVIAGVIERGHGAGPAAGTFRRITEGARRDGVRVIVVDLPVQSSAAEALAREIGGRILQLNTMGVPGDPERGTYPGMMRANARALARALMEER